MTKKQKNKKEPKKIERTKITLPNNRYQPSMEEMREEVQIPLSLDELADLVVGDYEIEHEE